MLATPMNNAATVRTARWSSSSVRIELRGVTVGGVSTKKTCRERKKKPGQGLHPDPVPYDELRGTYGAQAGSPSPADVTTGFVVLTAIPHDVLASCVWL